MESPTNMDALLQAVDEYQTPLLRYAQQLLRHNPDAAQDVVQEAFIRLHHALHTSQPITQLRPWLYRVTHNLAIDLVRRSARTDSLDAQPDLHQPATLHEDSQADAQALALGELNNLPPEIRLVLHLKILDNHTLQEVATITSTPISTVNYRLAKGLRILADAMRAKGVTYP